METRARSHTRESLNKPDEPQNRTRRLSEMSRLLVLFDSRPRLCRQRPRANNPDLSPLCKGVNSQPPVPLGLEHQAAGWESALRAASRLESREPRQLSFPLDMASCVRMRGRPSRPHANPAPHSLLFLRNPRSALQPDRA